MTMKEGSLVRYRYTYSGPVMEFNTILTNRWFGETVANSDNQARVYLAYQFKSQNNRSENARITLIGDVKRHEVVM